MSSNEVEIINNIYIMLIYTDSIRIYATWNYMTLNVAYMSIISKWHNIVQCKIRNQTHITPIYATLHSVMPSDP